MEIQRSQIDSRLVNLFVNTFGFTTEEFDYLLSHFELMHLKKKEHYFRAGDVCRQQAYINKGCTRTYVLDNEGHERILFFAVEDWWIGDLESYYTQKPGVNFVQALEDCELLIIKRELFQKLAVENPKMQQWYSYKVQRAANAMWRRLTEVKVATPEERYLNMLNNQPQLLERVPLQYIAAYLNIEPQSLSRLRKRLAKKV
jgi:CRP-like cAMP-binding protein